MRNVIRVFATLALMAFMSRAMAQDTTFKWKTAVAEIGFSYGQSGQSFGSGGGVGIRAMWGKWGGAYHSMGFSGLQSNGSYFVWGPGMEYFKESAVMASRQIWTSRLFRLIGSTGVGWLKGRELNEAKTGFVSLGTTKGWAMELAIGTVGTTAGGVVSFSANINDKRPLCACTISFALGFHNCRK